MKGIQATKVASNLTLTKPGSRRDSRSTEFRHRPPYFKHDRHQKVLREKGEKQEPHVQGLYSTLRNQSGLAEHAKNPLDENSPPAGKGIASMPIKTSSGAAVKKQNRPSDTSYKSPNGFNQNNFRNFDQLRMNKLPATEERTQTTNSTDIQTSSSTDLQKSHKLEEDSEDLLNHEQENNYEIWNPSNAHEIDSSHEIKETDTSSEPMSKASLNHSDIRKQNSNNRNEEFQSANDHHYSTAVEDSFVDTWSDLVKSQQAYLSHGELPYSYNFTKTDHSAIVATAMEEGEIPSGNYTHMMAPCRPQLVHNTNPVKMYPNLGSARPKTHGIPPKAHDDFFMPESADIEDVKNQSVFMKYIFKHSDGTRPPLMSSRYKSTSIPDLDRLTETMRPSGGQKYRAPSHMMPESTQTACAEIKRFLMSPNASALTPEKQRRLQMQLYALSTAEKKSAPYFNIPSLPSEVSKPRAPDERADPTRRVLQQVLQSYHQQRPMTQQQHDVMMNWLRQQLLIQRQSQVIDPEVLRMAGRPPNSQPHNRPVGRPMQPYKAAANRPSAVSEGMVPQQQNGHPRFQLDPMKSQQVYNNRMVPKRSDQYEFLSGQFDKSHQDGRLIEDSRPLGDSSSCLQYIWDHRDNLKANSFSKRPPTLNRNTDIPPYMAQSTYKALDSVHSNTQNQSKFIGKKGSNMNVSDPWLDQNSQSSSADNAVVYDQTVTTRFNANAEVFVPRGQEIGTNGSSEQVASYQGRTSN